jgi:hypothetical protein
MDINTASEILDQIPSRSNYEFKNFELEAQGSWHRQLRYALDQKLSLTDSIEILQAEIELLQYEADNVTDSAEAAIRRRIADAKANGMQRTIFDLQTQLAQVDSWLGQFTLAECREAPDSFENSEAEHWSEQLGRQIGVELLSIRHATKETMHQMSLLPLADFKKSVLISNQFANFLQKTTEQVEATLEQNKPQAMANLPAETAQPPIATLSDNTKAKKTKR